ncbi:BAHD acyltransferase [Prunus yedoensis var. nudiflora]|uniref:BAHD acyltransferase n=1 Tax=Prunus yedoensis var. nudiflora TaxID=2094558 RepID=A0A314V010_PRUYE|nr:BAHD acyltransferase [Prunus yedoensis var. nudiflora]
MVSEIKVEVIHKETIEPSSPTPHHLKKINLSVFDQFQPEIYTPLLLFYPSTSDEGNIDHKSLFAEKSKLLKRSLSEALTHFYPFAGEFVYNASITCNDHRAAFLDAQVNCPISKILEKPDFEVLNQFLPTAIESKQAEAGYILLVQASLFECGGLAIGVSILHKVADASTLSAFIKRWAAIALGSASTTDHVEFGVASSLFPPLDFFSSPQFSIILSNKNCITKRFVFDASKIAALKSKVATTVPNPTRVEVVSALIWKCIIQASRSKFGAIKPSMWCPVVNMRKRSLQGLAENILGNFVWVFAAMAMEREVKFESLVVKLRKGIEQYKEKYPNGVTGEDIFQAIKGSGNLAERDDLETNTCSSWCRLPLYETEFGWGKPSWVSTRSTVKNTIMLMDLSDGEGVEALVTLKEEDMTIIESNEELLPYASLNPTVI